MHFKYLPAIISFATLVLFTGCRSNVDLENIDKRAEMELGIALPIGTMHATVGDLLGTSDFANLCVDSAGVFHYIDTIKIPTKRYHSVDLTSYLLENDDPFSFYVQDQFGGASTIYGDGSTVMELEFPMSLSTEHFNTDVNNERVDSILVSSANFVSIIDVNSFDLKWSEIKKVELELDKKQCRRPKGNKIEIPIKDYAFDEEIPIVVKDFTMNLMDGNGGTVPAINYTIRFYVCPADGHNIALTDKSKFSYDLKVKVIDYDAIWGFFQAGKDMKDKERMNMDSLWEDWQDLKKLKVRFMEPTMDVYVTHRVAAPLRMNMDYLIAIDSLGNSTNATWNGSTRTDFDLPVSLTPYSPSLNDSVTNMFRFSYKPEEGHLDQLFDVRPDYFEYSFFLEVDKKQRTDYPWKQHRITKDVRITGHAISDVPFKMNKGSEIEYTSLKDETSINRLSLDSLVKSIDVLEEVKASDIKLIIQVENGIPFNMDAYFTFLDKNGNDMKLRLVEDNKENHLRFPAPKMARAATEVYGHVVEPSSSRYIFSIGKNEFDRLAEVKSINMHVAMTDNPEPCMLAKDEELRIKMGLSTHVDAVLNFENVSNNNNQ